ncbi:hypothetical protein MSPP1_002308 [Malassezia sp. CBS 17886]|nr:hypothetical protein MSPP1_002308 [Malassezia sp. CBS 17886]
MNDPVNEIPSVVKGLVCAKNATDQRNVMQRYATEDFGFQHPLCCVRSFPGSRDMVVLPIYQWLRMMFMDTLIEVHDVGALFVMLDLVKGADGKLYLAKQTDVYEVQDLLGIIGLRCPVVILRTIAAYMCVLFVRFFQLFGIWVPAPQ